MKNGGAATEQDEGQTVRGREAETRSKRSVGFNSLWEACLGEDKQGLLLELLIISDSRSREEEQNSS